MIHIISLAGWLAGWDRGGIGGGEGGNPVDLKVDEEGVAWGMGMNGWMDTSSVGGKRERKRYEYEYSIAPQPLDERKK